MTTNQLGRWSAFGQFLIGIAYFVALTIGFAVYGSAPIVDPLLAVMEVLTLVSAPLLVVMMAAVHGYAPPDRKTHSLIALAFMILVAGTTSAVHFAELTALRQLGSAGIAWPSAVYAVELLAWNLLLGLSLLFAAPVFEDSGLQGRIRLGLLICGALCLLGVIGPAVGDMRLQLVGVFGYGFILPVVCFMLSTFFRGDPGTRSSPAA